MIMTGYSTHDDFYATRYRQGSRTVYNIDLSLLQVDAYLPVPNPAQTTEGNRRVKEKHAKDFGDYVRKNKEWVAPALLLRAPDIFTFETKENIAGAQFGILSMSRSAHMELKIVDGQHRILGIHFALASISNELAEQRNLLAKAKKNGEEVAVRQQFENKIELLTRQRERFENERISIQIHIEDDADNYKQMFVDVAENALGISSAIRARFDNRRIVNRCLDDVLKHALLSGRVDQEQDRITTRSSHLLGAKHVVDIIRTLAVGIDGRIGARKESELNEAHMVEQTNDFLDALLNAFPLLARVADDELAVTDLRGTSLLGSVTMLRILAGVHHNLLNKQFEPEQITEFFRLLAPHMVAPVPKDSLLLEHTKSFDEGVSSPKSQAQDMRLLVKTLGDWAVNTPKWLQKT